VFYTVILTWKYNGDLVCTCPSLVVIVGAFFCGKCDSEVFLSSFSLRIWLGVEFGTVSSDASVKIGFLFLLACDF
jgi:hypothetical protein